MLHFQANAQAHLNSVAIISNGQSITYAQLLESAQKIASSISSIVSASSAVQTSASSAVQTSAVAYMVTPGFSYVATQWGIWMAGGIAVPIAVAHPLESIKYIMDDTGAKLFICSPEFEELGKQLTGVRGQACADPQVVVFGQPCADLQVSGDRFQVDYKGQPIADPKKGAMILYTSGTTSLPKGVLTTHHTIEAQIKSLVEAWEYTSKDHTLCVLPLHHIHGIINVISCTLSVGGTVEFMPSFSPEGIFERFEKGQINVFMAVPTIYFKLITYLESLSDEKRAHYKQVMSKFRLMISGSAALPVSVMEKWEALSGQRLLERYGMTEIGMAISNPYRGERRAGHVGMPLPGVQVRLVDEENNEVVGQPGEIQIKGPNVFKEYWGKEKATAEAFIDGWFKTGDVAEISNGYYKILGRNSTDIIKSGGYKLSALEIEEVLRTHPAVSDCSVIGLPDEEWGAIVAAVVILNDASTQSDELNQFMRTKMPAYRVPRKYLFVAELPRNAMGKVTKNDLKKLF